MFAASLLIMGGGVAHAADPFVPHLPPPTGPFPVGVTDLHLVDHSRPDPWKPAKYPVRDVMTTVFYPAADVRGYPLASQMTAAAAEQFPRVDVAFTHPELPKAGVDWAATMSHAHVGAPARATRHPVLLYSPATADPRTLGTSLAEDLASRGYIVVAIDSPGETTEVDIPGQGVRIIDLTSSPAVDPKVFRDILTTRIADTRFVLDSLTTLANGQNPDAELRRLPAGLSRALDMRRVGIYGHSIGGSTAAETMYEDPRIKAAVNLEGFLDYLPDSPQQTFGDLLPVAANGTDRPLLLFGTDGYRTPRYDHGWNAMLAKSPCRTTVRRLTDANHWVFSDFGSMAAQFQAAGLMTQEQRNTLIGAIAPERSVPRIHNRVADFFGRHL
ncbi:alpha/beta hydrolase [Actinocrispum wychmicini]|uniref:alpha/beta hydrolase n=1 Tax=Actinocrispum wychmicini TaxID=1213861 RepID=UPI001FB6977B|nr:alpha/beta hydrolase [Actinocrispum wychmicini]